MFVRIEDHDHENFTDVTPEMANMLMENQVVYRCPCGNYHPAEDKEWSYVMASIDMLVN